MSGFKRRRPLLPLADRLHVSRATIRNHAQNIFAKLGVHSRLEAVAYAAQHRIL
jgi:DNA-binding NarL/FixJ family response regulator